MNRSNQPEIRNPILALPAARRLAHLPPETREMFRDLLLELSRDASDRANHAWKKHKAPMAMYWRAVAVYSRHIARVLAKEVRHGG